MIESYVTFVGRNGGHLTRNVFSSFLDRQALFNTSEATKSYLIEQYTSSSLVKFITEKGLSNKVDLVEGGHVTIFRTEEEESNARKDWAAAKEAGLDVDVTWIGNDELIEVTGFSILSHFSIAKCFCNRHMASIPN